MTEETMDKIMQLVAEYGTIKFKKGLKKGCLEDDDLLKEEKLLSDLIKTLFQEVYK